MRKFDVTPQQQDNGLTVAELFCGGGLMAVGLKTSGFNIVWANDFDKRAVQAYRHNIGGAVHADITTIDPEDIPDVDVIAGGPPCQDFSVAGKGAGADGERGKLVFSYLDIIKAKRPKAFIFENVKGLIGKKHRATFDALLWEFECMGYRVAWELINSWDYGVAQKRERVFIVGIRGDLGIEYRFPDPCPADYRTQVLRDVIGDLPGPIAVANHDPKELTDVAKAFLKRNPVSVRKNRPVGLEEPSRTLPAVLHKGIPYGLYNENPGHMPRRFTVRECLRIQSVPDWYEFTDDMPVTAMYRIVGNGVSSRVAWHLGKALAEQLKAAALVRIAS